MSRPATMISVLAQLPFMRTSDPDTNASRTMHLHGQLSTAREAATRYREAVLAHHDLTAALAALMGYQHAAAWNGYIPSWTDQHNHGEAYNPSPYRAGLVAIVLEAIRREATSAHYDATRLALVPARHVRAPWADGRDTPTEKGPGLWPESAP